MTSYLLAGPALEPVTVAEAKAYCRVDDDAEDGLIATLIAAARLHVEAHCRRALLAQNWRLVLNAWPLDDCVELPVVPVASLTAVTAHNAEGEAVALDLDQFQLDGQGTPPRLSAPEGVSDLPVLRRLGGIEIDYVAGYGETADDVPPDLKQAVLTLVGFWFENRDAALPAGMGSTPTGFAQLLAPYRRVRV